MLRRSFTADGTCIIEAILGPGDTSARASLEDVAMGAYKVVQQCVERKTPSEGGIAKDLGEGAASISLTKRLIHLRRWQAGYLCCQTNTQRSLLW